MADPVFSEAPEEVMRYFDAKGQAPSFDWRDIAPQEHALSYTVAKSTGYDVVDDIKAATRQAIADFKSYGDFVDQLEPTLRKKGWWGRQLVTDPLTGKSKYVQLGSLKRLRTIYWANVRTARAAGEWERIQRTKRGLPFLVYEMSVAEKKRPEHLGWVGLILPVDHPFWATHYPPNGWLCQCRVRQISRAEAERMGYDPEAEGPQIVYRNWTNKRTGEVWRVPRGIDPGWQTNPGLTRADNLRGFLAERLEDLSDNARRVAVADLVGGANFRALQAGKIPYAGALDRSPSNMTAGSLSLPVAVLPERVRELIGAHRAVVHLSNADAHKQLRKRRTASGAVQIRAEDYQLIQRLAEEGRLFEDVSSERTFALQAILDGKPWTAILRMTRDGNEIYLKSFRRLQERHLGPSARNIPMEN